ncbi:MAG: zinc-dependent alcohol dehydrogenase [Acidobacteriota bacterium]
MRAALLTQVNEPIVITDIEPPTPGYTDVIVRVEVCGLCHTDLHIADGHWKLPLLPLIPGHEVVGTIETLGEGVKGLTKGERVGVAWLYSACQTCELCINGYEMFCESQDNTGYTVNGGMAELIKVPANFITKIPEQLPSAIAATLLCAGVTPYRALKESGIHAGQTVAIFGVGGLGHIAIQLAKAMGFHIIAVDINDQKLELARTLGADLVVNADREAPAKYIRKLGGAHAVINLVASAKTMEEAFYALRRHGTLVVVGLPREEFTLPVIPFVGRGARIIGSVVGTRNDLREILALAAAGKVTTIEQERPLAEINEALADMRAGRINGRCVLRLIN